MAIEFIRFRPPHGDPKTPRKIMGFIFRELFDDPATPEPSGLLVHGIVDGKRIVGGGTFELGQAPKFFLSTFVVAEHYHGRGLGGELLNRMEEDARALGAVSIAVDTSDPPQSPEPNERSFFMHHGYTTYTGGDHELIKYLLPTTETT